MRSRTHRGRSRFLFQPFARRYLGGVTNTPAAHVHMMFCFFFFASFSRENFTGFFQEYLENTS